MRTRKSINTGAFVFRSSLARKEYTDAITGDITALTMLEAAEALGADARFAFAATPQTTIGTDTTYTVNYETLYLIRDHLGSVRAVTDNQGNILERNDYYPYGLQTDLGRNYPAIAEKYRVKLPNSSEDLSFANGYISEDSPTTSVQPYKLLYNGKELQMMAQTRLVDYGARQYDPTIARWNAPDPMAEDYYIVSSYLYCCNNPIIHIDFNGCATGDYYTKEGVWLGSDKVDDDKLYVADEYKDGKFTNAQEIKGVSHSEFKIVSNIIKKEAASSDYDEYKWLAHTANNYANKHNKSLYSLLKTGYSSVPDKNNGLTETNKSLEANYARAAVLDVFTGGKDPTNGSQLWDGTDFLAWGLNGPNNKPHNKFTEYSSVSIDKDIYDKYLNSQLSYYVQGTVRYYKKNYKIPANVFTDKDNWHDGSFSYSLPSSSKNSKKIKATGSYGKTIFWKIY